MATRTQAIAQVWSFELKALEARFGSAVTKLEVEGAMANIEVDLSHMLKKPRGSVSIVAVVPSDYPQQRPELSAHDPEGHIDPELMEELVQCGAAALQSAFAASGPAIFFAVDQVAALLRKRLVNGGEAPLRPAELPERSQAGGQRGQRTNEAEKPRRRRRRRSGGVPMVLPFAEKDDLPAPSAPLCEEKPAKASWADLSETCHVAGSWSTGISTPSSISEDLSSSSSSSESSDSSSSGMSDDEMQKIAAQLHFNVRRQMLFKPATRGKEKSVPTRAVPVAPGATARPLPR